MTTEASQQSRQRRRIRLTGLRTRLLAGFAAVALLTTVAIAGVSYALTRRAMVEQAQQSAERTFKSDMAQEAGEVASVVASTAPQHQQQALQNIATRLAGGPQKAVLIINPTTGFENSLPTIVQQDVPVDLRESVRTGMVMQRTHINGTPYVVLGTQITSHGPQVYEFYSLSSDEQDLDRLAQSYVYAAAVALLAASLLALLAAQGVLRPIRRLGLAARRLGEGHLDTRAEVRGSDEIADVARTFNDTAAALEQGVRELRAMEAASRRFVADVSHELRTPLTAMTAVTDMLEDATDVGDESAPATRLVVTETRRLARLVEDLIEVSRFDAGTAALRLEDVDFVQLVEASLAARGWRDKVTRHVPERLMTRVDPRRIDVIVANLVGNALKHGGEPVSLRLSAQGDDLLLTVRDRGPGIPADALPHVFERFYKADRARGRSEGSGLGLSIASENARMHGGRLEARNETGGGASFSLLLPGVRQPEESAAGEASDGETVDAHPLDDDLTMGRYQDSAAVPEDDDEASDQATAVIDVADGIAAEPAEDSRPTIAIAWPGTDTASTPRTPAQRSPEDVRSMPEEGASNA
jgi:two-component system sensor histidine kinase MtrB